MSGHGQATQLMDCGIHAGDMGRDGGKGGGLQHAAFCLLNYRQIHDWIQNSSPAWLHYRAARGSGRDHHAAAMPPESITLPF